MRAGAGSAGGEMTACVLGERERVDLRRALDPVAKRARRGAAIGAVSR
jgi:hypothetical protein